MELADGGTLFLDEVSNLTSKIQIKLLHTLRERTFKRAEGECSFPVNFRLICATSQDLENWVVTKKFLADLYFQIKVVSINLPPLRERREDIPALADQLIQRYNLENKKIIKIAPQVMKGLCGCSWPGNIRELGNCLEHSATLAKNNLIQTLPCASRHCLAQMLSLTGANNTVQVKEKIHAKILNSSASHRRASFSQRKSITIIPKKINITDNNHYLLPKNESGQYIMREQLIGALEQCGWVQTKAARLLNVTTRQINYAVQKYQIDVKKF